MTPQEGLAWFARLSPSHIKMGLDRVQRALERLGHPERRFPAVHVAGTNGKGSTCAIIASCLRQRYRTALYTSPHLIRPNERIQIDGVEIDDDTFGRRIVEVLERLGPDHELTYFEVGTLVAFWHFAEERVDVAVLETGLGGRLDATTACMPLWLALEPMVLISRPISWATKPSLRPWLSLADSVCSKSAKCVVSRTRSSVMSLRSR